MSEPKQGWMGTPTPRVDALADRLRYKPDEYRPMWELARELERECEALRAALIRAEKWISGQIQTANEVTMHDTNTIIAVRAALAHRGKGEL